MKRLVRRARQAAPFSEVVFIEGESGTGKQLLAEAIHAESTRKGKPLVEVNCGAIPKELFESQFFGHTKGSFTGSTGDSEGYFEQADGGTLFLDEVGELSLEHQVKLLRVLQEKKVRRVGGKADISVDVRVIAATNRNLLEEVRAGRFREDLYYRLSILVFKLPPLRERQGDVGFLIQKTVDKLNAEFGGRAGFVQKKLSPGATNLLLRHGWPGNVRELEATLRRAFIWSKGAGHRRGRGARRARNLTPRGEPGRPGSPDGGWLQPHGTAGGRRAPLPVASDEGRAGEQDQGDVARGVRELPDAQELAREVRGGGVMERELLMGCSWTPRTRS